MMDRSSTDRQEICAGLLQLPARIAPKYFYDVRGSALFEEITRLPEYYPTRTEAAVMQAHGADILQKVGAGGTVIEFGAGSCEKARGLCRLLRPQRFVAVDISAEFLHESVARLRGEFPGLEVLPLVADLGRVVELPAGLPRERRLLFYPGSSIGNFDPPQALELLTRFRGLMAADGALLIGIDLVKDIAVLEAAYDDAAGVTAAFNLNVLDHVNRLIGSDFEPAGWRHVAFYNVAASRIEMHLEALAATRVSWPGGERRFAAGERIHTENSYKYRLAEFFALLARAGFSRSDAWTDPRDWFAAVLARP
ncbi:MAG: L-histidine N(alpha)-methyltransferase [Sulfuritalea sp.]|nr:L-histidine N(alpha)-methyltransferase [Sulfuritalea sp.]